jgi:O-antigen/teichoic acid export membrane protein
MFPSEPKPPHWLGYLPERVRVRIAERPGLLKILGNIGWLSFDKALRVGVGLFVGVWVARYLGPEQFGQLSFAMAFVALFGAIATMGLPGILVRDLVRAPEHAPEFLGTGVALQVVGAILALVLAVLAIGLLRPENTLMKALVAIIGLSLLFKAMDPVRYWFESRVESKYVVWGDNGVFLAAAGIRIGLILAGAPLITFAWLLLAEAVLTALALVVVYRKVGPANGRWQLRLERASKLLRDSWPLVFAGMAVLVYMKIDQIMLGQMLNDEAVGIYSAAARISEVFYFIPVVISASVFPAIIRARSESESLYMERLQRLYDILAFISLIVALPLSLMSGWLTVALFGPAYEAAGPVLAIHVWALIFVALGVASSAWLLAENRQMLSLQRALLGAVVNIVLNAVLILDHGPVGAAYATVISYAVAGLFYDFLRCDTRPMFRMKVMALYPIRLMRWLIVSIYPRPDRTEAGRF